MRWLASNTNSMDVNLGRLHETVEDTEARPATVHGGHKSQTRLGDGTALAVRSKLPGEHTCRTA